jgi:hypothetical protein
MEDLSQVIYVSAVTSNISKHDTAELLLRNPFTWRTVGK